MIDDQQYERWLEQRRRAEVPEGFSNRVMKLVDEKCEAHRNVQIVRAQLLGAVLASWPGKFAICFAAFLVGMIPFAYLAYLAQLFAFNSAAGWTFY